MAVGGWAIKLNAQEKIESLSNLGLGVSNKIIWSNLDLYDLTPTR